MAANRLRELRRVKMAANELELKNQGKNPKNLSTNFKMDTNKDVWSLRGKHKIGPGYPGYFVASRGKDWILFLKSDWPRIFRGDNRLRELRRVKALGKK